MRAGNSNNDTGQHRQQHRQHQLPIAKIESIERSWDGADKNPTWNDDNQIGTIELEEKMQSISM